MSLLRAYTRHFTRLFHRNSKLMIVITCLLTVILCLNQYTSTTRILSQNENLPQDSSDSHQDGFIIPTGSVSQSGYTLDSIANKKIDFNDPNNSGLKTFYSFLMSTLVDMSPKGELEGKYSDDCKIDGAVGVGSKEDENYERVTFDSLNSCLEIPDDKLELLREKHRIVTDTINLINLPEGIIKDAGVVIVGGSRYSVLAASNIQIMRDFNTTLPVEVFIPPGEDDPSFCKEYLPKFNAKCTHIEDILNPDVLKTVEFKGYQYKSLALLASKFEHILFLDADNFPMKNLDIIFNEVSYKEKGMILWSDFWRRTDSPKYYDIAGIKYNRNKRVRNLINDVTPVEVYTKNMNDLKDVPFHDMEGTVPDMSTESGQVVINKKIHWKSIVLSLYYNLNGPKWYYPIFSQGAPGEGDKETFASAATVFNLPFYQVRRRPGVGGYHDNDFHGVCMYQEDFRVDYNNYLTAEKEIKKEYKDVQDKSSFKNENNAVLNHFYDHYFSHGDQNIMFVHFNLPKLDPIELSKHHTFISDDGKQLRSISNLKPLGYFDLELNVHLILKDMLCGDHTTLAYVNKSFEDPETSKEKVCGYIETRIKYLSATHVEATTPK